MMLPAAALATGRSPAGRNRRPERPSLWVGSLISDQIDAGFCQFYGHPQLDLAQNLVKLVVA